MPVPDALPRPSVVPPQPYVFPEPRRCTLDNGLTVLAYDLPGQYVHSMRLAVPLPLSVEPPQIEGVATIMARTLDEGTTRHTSAELARLLERRGVALGAGMSDSGLSVDIDAAKGNLGYGLGILRECLAEPSFPEVEVDRHVKVRLAEIAHERSAAGARAAIELAATYFDSSTRASRPTGGTVETMHALRCSDVAAFHARYVASAGATVVVAGDFSGMDPFVDVESALGSWTGTSDHEPVGPWQLAPVAADRARVVVVDRPGSVQTEIMVCCPGPDRHVDTGWAPYPVASFVVGGSPTSRLDALLREDKGYTYGVRSSFRPRRVDGIFVTSGSVRVDVTAEALGLLLDVLDHARDGFTEAETHEGAQFLSMTAAGRFATADTIADEAIGLACDGLGTEFTTSTLREIATMDPERLGTAYRRFVDGTWTVVLVGDAAAIVDRVRDLGRGEVTVVPS
jgi:predicted Zn-dependent peptidase